MLKRGRGGKWPSAFEQNEQPSLLAWEARPVSECSHGDWRNAAAHGDLECTGERTASLENPQSK